MPAGMLDIMAGGGASRPPGGFLPGQRVRPPSPTGGIGDAIAAGPKSRVTGKGGKPNRARPRETSNTAGSGSKKPSRARGTTSTSGLKPGDTPGVGGPQSGGGELQVSPQGTQQPGLGDRGGMDLFQPGVLEQYQQQNQGRFTQPGEGSQFFGQTEGAYRAPGFGEQQFQQSQAQLGAQGQGEQFWQQIRGQMNQRSASEQMNQDPGLGAYYDRAKERTAGDINNQLAARGSFGSSAGVSQISDAMVGLESERANREGDFRQGQAQQADQQRMARLGLGGQMASGAQGLGLQRLGLGGQLAGQAQDQRMDRLGQGQQAASSVDQFGLGQAVAGANVAGAAQDATRNRAQDYFQNTMAAGGVGQSIVGGGMGQQQAIDRQMFESQIAMALGIPAEQLRQQQYNQQMGLATAGTVIQGVGVVGQIIASLAGGGG